MSQNILYFVFVIFCIATVVQLLFWLFIFSKLAFWNKKSDYLAGVADFEQPVSIVICAHNEAENLRKNLPFVIHQAYPRFEILLINDASTDDTETVGLFFQSKHTNFRLINVLDKPKEQVGKKYVVAQGIEAAQYDVVLLTDADCRPTSDLWLQKMQASLADPAAEISLGYGPYWEEASFLNKFIRFETVQTAMQYFSFALAEIPYMGVGRNLIYKKYIFKKNNGFAKHQHIASGDDDLFVRDVANADNTRIVLDPETFVLSAPKRTWAQFYGQKSRHLTTGKHYAARHKILLGAVSTSHFFHYSGVLILCALKFSTMFAVTFYAVRMAVVWFLYGRILKKLREPRLVMWIPLLDFLYVGFYAVFAPVLFFSRTNKWK